LQSGPYHRAAGQAGQVAPEVAPASRSDLSLGSRGRCVDLDQNAQFPLSRSLAPGRGRNGNRARSPPATGGARVPDADGDPATAVSHASQGACTWGVSPGDEIPRYTRSWPDARPSKNSSKNFAVARCRTCCIRSHGVARDLRSCDVVQLRAAQCIGAATTGGQEVASSNPASPTKKARSPGRCPGLVRRRTPLTPNEGSGLSVDGRCVPISPCFLLGTVHDCMTVKPRKANRKPTRVVEEEAEREASAYVRAVLTWIPAEAVCAGEVRRASRWTRSQLSVQLGWFAASHFCIPIVVCGDLSRRG
jgi:hypothetical protein